MAYTNKNVSGENLTTEVYGAAALGPKIGNGFFANLYGHFEQLTMDRWLMRTWGRWTGTLLDDNRANIATKRKQDKLANQLTWLANRQILNLPEDRRHDRSAVRGRSGHGVAPGASPLPAHSCLYPSTL